MMKFTLLLLTCLLLVPAFAQKVKKDLVYLKSGGVIKGQVITHDAEIVKINSAGNEWVFKNEEVDSISKYMRQRNEERRAPGYFFDTSMGVLVGNSGSSQSAPFSFMSSFNVKVLKNVYLGAGLGAEFFQESYLPAFGQLQWRFRDHTKTTPFINLQGGYQFALEDGNHNQWAHYDYSSSYYPTNTTKITADGGYFINPSFGFQRYTSDNFGWFFSFGYRYQQLNYSGDHPYELETNFSRLSLKIGFIFN